MDLDQAVLRAALRGRIDAADRDSGLAQLAASLGGAAPAAAGETVARLVAAGLLHDPVRLEPGALQCHWRLELTPSGYAALRPAPAE